MPDSRSDRGASRFLFKPVKGAAQIVVLALIGILLLAANVLYANRINRMAVERYETEQFARDAAWCAFLIPVVERYKTQPPMSVEDKKVATNTQALYVSYRCDDHLPAAVEPPPRLPGS
jgi:hypothetical protein